MAPVTIRVQRVDLNEVWRREVSSNYDGHRPNQADRSTMHHARVRHSTEGLTLGWIPSFLSVVVGVDELDGR